MLDLGAGHISIGFTKAVDAACGPSSLAVLPSTLTGESMNGAEISKEAIFIER